MYLLHLTIVLFFSIQSRWQYNSFDCWHERKATVRYKSQHMWYFQVENGFICEQKYYAIAYGIHYVVYKGKPRDHVVYFFWPCGMPFTHSALWARGVLWSSTSVCLSVHLSTLLVNALSHQCIGEEMWYVT